MQARRVVCSKQVGGGQLRPQSAVAIAPGTMMPDSPWTIGVFFQQATAMSRGDTRCFVFVLYGVGRVVFYFWSVDSLSVWGVF